MAKQYYVYILTNPTRTVLYTGVTNNLIRRICQHKEKLVPGFTKKYNVCRLVYYEVGESPYSVIQREKQIKAGSRRKKMELIEGMNPDWRDLYEDILK